MTLLPGVDAVAGQWVTAVVTETMGVDLIAAVTSTGSDAAG